MIPRGRLHGDMAYMPLLLYATHETVVADTKHSAQDAVAGRPSTGISEPQSTPVALRAIVHGERQCF